MPEKENEGPANLTDDERKLLKRMEAMGRWDGVTLDLCIGIPSVVILALSVYYDSTVGVAAAAVTYGSLRLWITMQQDAMTPTLQSLLQKLKAGCASNS